MTTSNLENCVDQLPYANFQTEDYCLSQLKRFPEYFQFILNQTPLIISTAIDLDPHNLQYVFFQTKDIILQAVRGSSSALKYASFQDDEIVYEAFLNSKKKTLDSVKDIKTLNVEIGVKLVETFGSITLKYIRNQHEEIVVAAILTNWNALQYVHEKTESIVALALEVEPLSLKYLGGMRLSNFFYEKAVGKNGLALEFIDNQNESLCKIAITQNPESLKFVRDQTPELIELAIEANPFVVTYVKNITEDIALHAIKKRPEIINLLSIKHTEAIILAAVSRNGLLLEFVQFQNAEIIAQALDNNPLSIEYVHDQTIDHVRSAVKKNPKAYLYAKFFDRELAILSFSQHPSELHHKMNHPNVDDNLLKTVLSINGAALEQIPQRKTFEMECIAVKQNWRSLQFVSNLTEEICVSAYEQDIRAFYFMWNKARPIEESAATLCIEQVQAWDTQRQMECEIYTHSLSRNQSRKRLDII